MWTKIKLMLGFLSVGGIGILYFLLGRKDNKLKEAKQQTQDAKREAEVTSIVRSNMAAIEREKISNSVAEAGKTKHEPVLNLDRGSPFGNSHRIK